VRPCGALAEFRRRLTAAEPSSTAADALVRKAHAGHVTGGRVFGYDNESALDSEGRRLRVERRVNGTEAAVVRRIFERHAAGAGLRAIADEFNAEAAPAPLPQRTGGPAGGRRPACVRFCTARPTVASRSTTGPGSGTDGAVSARNGAPQEDHPTRDARAARRLRGPLGARARAALRRPGAVRTRHLWNALGRPPSEIESKFLLTGLGVCGESL